jgi:hypothetical protein
VPGQVDVPQPEAVELHSHAACLLRHVYDGARGDWPHPGRSTRMT